MKRLIFEAPSNHYLNEDGEQIPGGGEFTVTDERAEQLLADVHVPVVEAPESDLIELTRADLNAKATELGVEQPERLPNKDAVLTAIANAESAAAESGEGPHSQEENA